jgi:hypothetical protein
MLQQLCLTEKEIFDEKIKKSDEKMLTRTGSPILRKK